MISASHLEVVLSRIQRIVSTVSTAQPPLTEHEALEQILEELELAGFGAQAPEAELEAASPGA
jgi:hypothetical protein